MLARRLTRRGCPNIVTAHREAWHSRAGLSRTEAKRRYISTLIETMHQYATTTSEARELVAELEFVWDQIRSNSASSAGSSPGQSSGSQKMQQTASSAVEARQTKHLIDPTGLRLLRPLSDKDEEDELLELEAADDGGYDEGELEDRNVFRSAPPGTTQHDARWRKRVEQALFNMTTEIAALREQMESSTLNRPRKRRGIWPWILWLAWTPIRHLLIDAALAALLIIWSRKSSDARLEQGLRIFLDWSRHQVRKLQALRLTKMTSSR